MRVIIYIILMSILFGGCAKPVSVAVDTTALEELPKEMAIEYLKMMSEDHPTLRFYQCIVYADHVDYRQPQNGVVLSIYYDQANMEAVAAHFDGGVGISLQMKLRSGGFYGRSCVIAEVQGFKTENDPEIQRTANKVATALKSLGVKIEEK